MSLCRIENEMKEKYAEIQLMNERFNTSKSGVKKKFQITLPLFGSDLICAILSLWNSKETISTKIFWIKIACIKLLIL